MGGDAMIKLWGICYGRLTWGIINSAVRWGARGETSQKERLVSIILRSPWEFARYRRVEGHRTEWRAISELHRGEVCEENECISCHACKSSGEWHTSVKVALLSSHIEVVWEQNPSLFLPIPLYSLWSGTHNFVSFWVNSLLMKVNTCT